MGLLILGMLIFMGVHLVPMAPGLRRTLVERLGENGYKGIFSLISLAGFVTLIWGKADADLVYFWNPPEWGGSVATPLMFLAFVGLVAKNLSCNLNRFTRHPMLWGVTLWSIAHLLTNGDLASVILFGGFALYALLDMWSANMRGAVKATVKFSVGRDLVVLAVALAVYIAFGLLHPYLFGVAVVNLS